MTSKTSGFHSRKKKVLLISAIADFIALLMPPCQPLPITPVQSLEGRSITTGLIFRFITNVPGTASVLTSFLIIEIVIIQIITILALFWIYEEA